MRNYKSIIGAILMLCMGMTTINAQQVILTSGCSSSCAGGSICYSVGQVCYSSFSGTFGYINEGVQQISSDIIIGIDGLKGANFIYSVHPNPTTNYIRLEIKDYPIEGLCYQLFDATGKILMDEGITSNSTDIDLCAQISAIYFLKIIDKRESVNVYKIIKK